MKKLCFDIDGVICKTFKNKYEFSKPDYKVIKIINKLYDNGNYIIIFTARYMGRNNQKISKAKKQGYAFTLNQLKIWNVKFHKLIFGKPSYDLIIDDKGLGFKKNWYVNFI
jgi:CMP-N,N'-diacetyllegionaminic acid synthase